MSKKNYTHLTEDKITDGNDIREIMKDLDEQTQMQIIMYARGLRDMQEAIGKKSA